jgi:catecholate siderophore receptor
MTKDDAHLQPLRLPLFAGSVAVALFLCEAGSALAQEAPGAPSVTGVLVKGQPPQGYKVDEPAMVKLTQPIIDTPQMLSITSRQVMEDRGAVSLTDVFRNSSGISIGAGESSWIGNNLTLRGFNARNDMYLDGMRDFGGYTRDPFDLEEVEVLQGPSSVLFGRGSTGGVVNQVSKMPTLNGFERSEVSGGTDDLLRGAIDLDAPIAALGPGVAVRFDAMAHRQDFTDLDHAFASRWGVAPSLAFGLDTPTRLVLGYLHQGESDLPDYGLPYLRGAPAPVARNNFYGFQSDFQHAQVDVFTGRLEHDVSSSLTIRDQLRFANYAHQWREMEPQVISAGVTATTPLWAIDVNRALQGGHDVDTFLQNQMDLLGVAHTGAIEHDFAAGWEIGPESSKPSYDFGLNIPATSLLAPSEDQAFSGTEYRRAKVSTTAFTVGAYAIDTMKLGPHWELSGGVRFDSFDAHYVAQYYSPTPATLGQPTTRQDVHELDQKPSWRASLVYKPTPNGSIYFDYSTSFNPSAESLSLITAVRSLNTGNIGLAPEFNETYEVGTKWALLADRLQLQAAIFREEKDNAREPDPANSAVNILAGDQQVDGAEVELQGQITEAWRLSASYTYLDGKTVKTVAGGPPLGSPLFNAPKSALALWTTYRFPFRVEVGGGLNCESRRYASLTTNPFTSVPGYTTLDAMVKWQATQHMRLQVNLSNLTDKTYYDQLHGFHVIPGEGRTAMFTLAFTG